VPTYNNEETIAACLKSLTFVGEILLVDSFSTDNTLVIAKKYRARVIQHIYKYSAKQKNWAIPRSKYNWVMVVDSDEVVSLELAKNIKALFKNRDLNNYDGFTIARRHYFLERWLKFGGRYPLFNIRLFRRNCRYENRDVHAHIILPKSRIGKLKGDIWHYSDRSVEQIIDKFNRYTTYQANYILKLKHKGLKLWRSEILINPFVFKSVIKDLWYFLPGSSFYRFIYMFFIRLGFLDGRFGFLLALLYGFSDYIAKVKAAELIRGKVVRQIGKKAVMLGSLYFLNAWLSPVRKLTLNKTKIIYETGSKKALMGY